MTAARDAQAAVLRGQHRRAEIDARSRPARPLTDAITIECDDDGGAAELFLQPTGDDPDHTWMPALPRHQRDGAGALRSPERLGGLRDAHPDRTAFPVEPPQPGRHPPPL